VAGGTTNGTAKNSESLEALEDRAVDIWPVDDWPVDDREAEDGVINVLGEMNGLRTKLRELELKKQALAESQAKVDADI
jgi:hypothetical protein